MDEFKSVENNNASGGPNASAELFAATNEMPVQNEQSESIQAQAQSEASEQEMVKQEAENKAKEARRLIESIYMQEEAKATT